MMDLVPSLILLALTAGILCHHQEQPLAAACMWHFIRSRIFQGMDSRCRGSRMVRLQQYWRICIHFLSGLDASCFLSSLRHPASLLQGDFVVFPSFPTSNSLKLIWLSQLLNSYLTLLFPNYMFLLLLHNG